MRELFKAHKKMTIAILILLVVGVAGVVTAAVMKQQKKEVKSEETTTQEQTTEATEEETTEQTDNHKGKERSHLTGEYVDKSFTTTRPVAVMINNIQDAIPQSGIGTAGVIYEATVEGGITRLMGLFEQYPKRIGSVRSCRFYYAYWATEWDAFYTHWGQSSYALDFLESGKVDYLNAMDDSANTTFIKDDSIAAPHNIFATAEGMKATIKSKKYRTRYKKDFEDVLHFETPGNSVVLKKAKNAKKVEMNYPVNHSYFVYNSKTKLYQRYQYGAKHIDQLTNKQLTCKNIIVEKADAPLFDDGKSVNFAIIGSGEGMYFTEGKGIKIKWEKESETTRTRYYNMDGEELTLNAGKTWICVMPKDQELTISAK